MFLKDLKNNKNTIGISSSSTCYNYCKKFLRKSNENFFKYIIIIIHILDSYQLQNNNNLIKSTNAAVLFKNIKCISIKNQYFFLFLFSKKFL